MNNRSRLPIQAAVVLVLGMVGAQALAEIRNAGTPMIRIRIGPGGGIGTVIYNAGIPADMGGLPGVTAEPSTVSTNNPGGGSGAFTVRVVTDVNARSGSPGPPLEGVFYYDSSNPMECVTSATCGNEEILFSKISWTARDNDTLNTEFSYTNDPMQEFQRQEDTSGSSFFSGTRHRNWYRMEYDNDTLLPAGTYEGLITINGVAN